MYNIGRVILDILVLHVIFVNISIRQPHNDSGEFLLFPMHESIDSYIIFGCK